MRVRYAILAPDGTVVKCGWCAPRALAGKLALARQHELSAAEGEDAPGVARRAPRQRVRLYLGRVRLGERVEVSSPVALEAAAEAEV
jgi:hypothetical protein